VALVGTLSAQTPVNFNVGGKVPTFTPVNTQNFLPRVDVSKAAAPTKAGARNFDFSKLLPNFSFIENRFPTRAPTSKLQTTTKK
jgi:hypothetical protein